MGPDNQAGQGLEPIIGIDLGTTNSLVAYCDERGPRVLADAQDRAILPSTVRFSENGRAEAVGHEAQDRAVEFASNTVFSVKRLMGRGIEDVQDELTYLPYEVVEGDHNTARVRIGKQVVSPQEVSAIILAKLRSVAQQRMGTAVRKAVVTVPAYFDDAQRQATRDAGRIAGLEVVRILNEPTAAALAYNLGQHHADATVAVFDLGGGTFDISILRLHQTDAGAVDQVLATDGDTHLGGDDVDRMIVELMQSEIRKQFGESIEFEPSTRQAFRSFAQAAKVRLSSEERTVIEVSLDSNRVYRRTLERGELEQMIAPWLERAIECCRRAFRSAKLAPGDIDRVILVGGSTRIPAVRKRVAEFFGTEPYTALDPDQVVALGAAAQASILSGLNRQMLLLDVIPLSLGIETMGGAVAKLIMANTTIPARGAEMFSTSVDGQSSVKIHVLQGEREIVEECRSLGQFELQGIPAMPAGLPKINVTFLVDANGILSVQAVEQRSGKASRVQIVPNHGLTRQEVERMEAESVAHAQEDMAVHQLIDLRNQARLDIRAIERQLEKVGDELDSAYRKKIEVNILAVKAFLEAERPGATEFRIALDKMDKSTVRLAEIAIVRHLNE